MGGVQYPMRMVWSTPDVSQWQSQMCDRKNDRGSFFLCGLLCWHMFEQSVLCMRADRLEGVGGERRIRENHGYSRFLQLTAQGRQCVSSST